MLLFQLNLHASSNYPIRLFDTDINAKNVGVKVSNEKYPTNVKIVSNNTNINIIDEKNPQVLCDDQFITYQFELNELLDKHFFAVELFTETTCVGKGYVTTENLMEHFGIINVYIHNDSQGRPIGSINFEYCIIKKFEKAFSGTQYSPPSFLYFGHRGCGSTNKRDTFTVENTLPSFQKAYENGADFIELDVQLTKDLVPIVFHDFHLTVFPEKKDGEVGVFSVPIRDMTYDQVKNYKVDFARPNTGQNHDHKFHAIAPTLEEVLKDLPKNLGILLEVKYPYQCAKTNEWEIENYFDKNTIIDVILGQVISFCGERPLMFCTFDPEMSLMLKFKQAKYPVIFNTVGESERYVYMDIRNRNGLIAANFVVNTDLTGVSISGDEFYDDRNKLCHLVNRLKNNGKKLFTYGCKNSEREYANFQKSIGISGIISDNVELVVEK